jgi:hypothetical protein
MGKKITITITEENGYETEFICRGGLISAAASHAGEAAEVAFTVEELDLILDAAKMAEGAFCLDCEDEEQDEDAEEEE